MMRNAHDQHRTDYDRAVETQLCAFNSAFADLGLRFRWDAEMLTSLATIDGEHARVVAYLKAHQAHLLNAYSAEFLCAAILAGKSARTSDVLPTRVVASGDARSSSGSVFSLSQYFSDDAVPALAGA
ncbi:hypothetical protein ACFQ3P_05540 [Paraburkholderia sabiae]|jgi:hypothetical protein|uniref:Uncharacterized protein n=1 Tax=Paraburkholderia sabiae TaxID=273251 RepID=A0ABU9QED2_9BURK|nr:hypothetical protein [Paraburkholderia sabiae]WJZ76718.1 hypothetical protein QEN71_13235 [Paraburkholderia sabiae]